MKIHIAALVDLSAKRGGWPSHYSLVGRCGRTQPQQATTKRKLATCKACLKTKAR